MKKLQEGIEFLGNANDQWRAIIGVQKHIKDCAVNINQEDVDQMNNPIQYTHTMYFPEILSAQVCADKAAEISGWPYVISAEPSFGFNGIWEERASDGVVLIESQMALPDGTMRAVHLINSSHMQIRNDENTRTSLRGLFEGTLEGTDPEGLSEKWFKTKTK